MAQYQSFPDARGDSRSVDKLKALRLPVLKDRMFLDVGCNEGYFCGFAKFAGAARSVGLDASREFIERARRRFPDCEFHCRGWDRLPDESFDVILLASALHYADDQPALLHALMNHLKPDGVLVLELGIVSSKKSEWVDVVRGIDERRFPSMLKLREILAPYASKWVGPSVAQPGDPVARHVVQVSPRRPVAYLLMHRPTHGKTSLAAKLFKPAGIKVVSGDLQLSRIARGELDVPEALRAAVVENFSHYRMDETIDKVFAAGRDGALVKTWLDEAGSGDFALDMYVPAAHQDRVREHLEDAGYLPVVLNWERPGPKLLGGPTLARLARDFNRSMRKRGAPAVDAAPAPMASDRVRGYVDRIKIEGGKLVIRGWAGTDDGRVPPVLTVRLKGRMVTCDEFETMDRADARKYLNVAEGKLGFCITLDAGDVTAPSGLGSEFAVAPPGGPSLRMTPAVARLVGRG